MMGAGISVATVINEVDALHRRGKFTLRIEGISVNYPLVIEVVDEQSKLDPLLPQIKRMVGDNGLVTI
jgi:PII-like signaling protein